MITSIFNKTRPINYIILSALLLVFYILFQNADFFSKATLFDWCLKIVSFTLLLGALYLSQFIYNRNNLVKDNMYGSLFFLSFCILLPSIFTNINVIGSVFFLILSFRRLISLKSMIHIKQKLFDATAFILIASLFHFWNILFLIVVFIAIVIHVAFDLRNWIIPIIATILIGAIILLYVMLFEGSLLLFLYESSSIDLSFNYFENDIQRITLAVFTGVSALFLISSLLSYSSKPLNQLGAYRMLYLILLVAIAVFIVSPNKSNSLLAFTFFPVSIFGTNLIEKLDNKWVQEAVILIIVLISLTTFFIQL
nr:DUF6427 family protein [uncultured Flavobacterium sp.]